MNDYKDFSTVISTLKLKNEIQWRHKGQIQSFRGTEDTLSTLHMQSFRSFQLICGAVSKPPVVSQFVCMNNPLLKHGNY